MSRKHNPLVALLALLLLALIVTWICTGCSKETDAEPEVVSNRFTIEVHKMNAIDFATVITDTDTGVSYLFYKSGYGGGLTKLEVAP